MYILIGIALYACLTVCIVRVFQSIHRRDEELRTMSASLTLDATLMNHLPVNRAA